MDDGKAARRAPAWWWRCRVMLYFVLGLVALDVVVDRHRQVWRAYDPDDYLVRLRACRRERPDLVVAGGSPVSEGIDPAVLAGIRWHGRVLESPFNLGLPGATTSEVWHAVEHGIAEPPRLLVYGLTASDVNDSRDEPHGPRSLMNLEDVGRWMRTRPATSAWCLRHYLNGRLSRLWQLYRHRNGIRLWAADRLEQQFPGLCPAAAAEARDGLRYTAEMRGNHGFAPRPSFQESRYDDLKAQGLVWKRFHFLEKYKVGGHLAYLHRIVDWAESHGVAVVLLDMPVSADLDEGLHPQAYARYRAAFAEVERDRGLLVLRASRQAVGLTDADFADMVHLNDRGTARLSAWLRDQLLRAGQD